MLHLIRNENHRLPCPGFLFQRTFNVSFSISISISFQMSVATGNRQFTKMNSISYKSIVCTICSSCTVSVFFSIENLCNAVTSSFIACSVNKMHSGFCSVRLICILVTFSPCSIVVESPLARLLIFFLNLQR